MNTIHWCCAMVVCKIISLPEMNECIPCCSNGKNNRHEKNAVLWKKGPCRGLYRGSFWWRWQLFNMNCYLHAAEAEPSATDNVVSFCYIQWNHVSSSSPSPICEWMIRVTCFIICLVHFQHARLVPIVHKICKLTKLAWRW